MGSVTIQKCNGGYIVEWYYRCDYPMVGPPGQDNRTIFTVLEEALDFARKVLAASADPLDQIESQRKG